MRMKSIKLFAMKEVGRDELNNPITEPVLIGLYKGVITPWKTEEIALLDRQVIQTKRKLLTDAPKRVIERADQVEVDGDTYGMNEVTTDTGRWRLCHVRL